MNTYTKLSYLTELEKTNKIEINESNNNQNLYAYAFFVDKFDLLLYSLISAWNIHNLDNNYLQHKIIIFYPFGAFDIEDFKDDIDEHNIIYFNDKLFTQRFEICRLEKVPNRPPDHIWNNMPKRFQSAWNKLSLWNLIKYETIIALDTDLYIIQSIQELFYISKDGLTYHTWPESMPGKHINGGLMVIKPNKIKFNKMMDYVENGLNNDEWNDVSNRGGQHFIELFFKSDNIGYDNVIMLSYIYNALLKSCNWINKNKDGYNDLNMIKIWHASGGPKFWDIDFYHVIKDGNNNDIILNVSSHCYQYKKSLWQQGANCSCMIMQKWYDMYSKIYTFIEKYKDI